MALLPITTDIFNKFGERNFVHKIYDNEKINGLVLTDKLIQDFKNICMDILRGSTNINRSFLNFCELKLLCKDPNIINEILVEIFNIFTNEMSESISKSIDENSFNIKTFITESNDLHKNAFLLRNFLYRFENCVAVKNTKKIYSHIYLICSYVFYRNVINKEYCVDGTNKYFWNILIDKLSEEEIDVKMKISHISHIHKLIRYYKSLSFITRNDNSLFNNEIDKNIKLTDLDKNNVLCDKFLETINDTIIQICKNKITDTTDIKNIIKPVASLLNTCENVIDKLKFIVKYSELLEKRLLEKTSSHVIENELLHNISYAISPSVHAKMRTRIIDMSESRHIENMFYNANIKIDSEKYKSFDQSLYDPKKCSLNIFGRYGWDLKENYKGTLPCELEVYSDVINKCYKIQYPKRNLSCSLDTSTCVATVTFNKIYKIMMTLAQYAVFSKINEEGNISATDLSQKLNIQSLNTIGIILNSLIVTKLIKREDGDHTNPDIRFYINSSFTFLSEKFSIVHVYKKLVDPSFRQTIQYDEAKLNMLVVHAIIAVPKMTIDEIIIKVAENEKNVLDAVGPYTKNDVIYIVNKLTQSNYIIENDGEYTHVTTNNDDDDTSDSDDEVKYAKEKVVIAEEDDYTSDSDED